MNKFLTTPIRAFQGVNMYAQDMQEQRNAIGCIDGAPDNRTLMQKEMDGLFVQIKDMQEMVDWAAEKLSKVSVRSDVAPAICGDGKCDQVSEPGEIRSQIRSAAFSVGLLAQRLREFQFKLEI